MHLFVTNFKTTQNKLFFFQHKQFLLLLHRIIFKNYPLVNQKSQFCLKVVQNYQLNHKELIIISNIVKYAQLLIFFLKKRRKHIIRQQQSQTNKDYGPKTTCYDNEKIYNSFQKELELQMLRLQNLSLIKLTVNQALNQKLICNILQFQFMKRYSIITVEKRRQLIEKVIFNSESLKKTAKQLKIKLSTAKHILRIFRREGRIFQKRANLDSKIEQNIQIQQQSQKNQQLDENYQISQIIIPQIQNNEYLFTNNWFPFQSNFNFDFQNFWWYFPWTSM